MNFIRVRVGNLYLSIELAANSKKLKKNEGITESV